VNSPTPTPLRAAFEARDHATIVRRGGAGPAFILRMAGAPVNFFMRRTAASGPKLLRMRSSR
jgi:hypothetical protein